MGQRQKKKQQKKAAIIEGAIKVGAYEYLQNQPMSNKQILKVLLKQKYDILKEFVSDMVYYAHKAECQDALSEEDFVIEQLKRRIADDASN